MGQAPINGQEAYEIDFKNKQNFLGSGSFGDVWKIIRKHDKLVCAGKFFKFSVSSMDPADKSIEIELEVLKQADHPFTIKYIEEL